MGSTHFRNRIGNLSKALRSKPTVVLGASALAAVMVAGTGCNSRLHDENAKLYQQNRELQARLDERSQLQASAASDVSRPADASHFAAPGAAATPPPVPPVAPAQPAPVPTVPDQPALSEGSDLAGLYTTENKLTGTLTVKFLGDELFDPGQATLKESSKKDLNKVAAALKKQYAGKTVRIEGHTDSDPIKHSKWGSNMELSKARADAVRKYLTGKGVPERLVTTQAFGDTKPKSTDPGKKSQNRRVEIVVLAK